MVKGASPKVFLSNAHFCLYLVVLQYIIQCVGKYKKYIVLFDYLF